MDRFAITRTKSLLLEVQASFSSLSEFTLTVTGTAMVDMMRTMVPPILNSIII